MRPIVPFVLVTLGLSLACAGKPSEKAGESASKPIAVTRAPVESAPMPERIQLVGTLTADRQVQVAADTNGVVVSTRVERGQSVKKGDVLAVVDTRLTQLSSTAQRAQAAAQIAQLDVAERECARAEELFAAGAISQAQLDRTHATCKAQKEAAAAARASSEAATTSADRTTIRAPFDGVVGERMVEVGSFVGSQTPVVTLFAPGPLRLRMTVPETQVAGVQEGRHVDLTPSAMPDAHFSATVRYVSGAIRESTRDLVVEAVLDEEPPGLRPGMFASATVEVGESPMLTVPEAAIVADGPVRRVFKVVDEHAYELVVRVGPEKDGRRAVLTDLVAGDQVVVSPPATLKDGGAVE